MANLILSREEMISSTEAVNQFSKLLDEVRKHKWFIARNNKIQAVLLDIEEYENLIQLQEDIDHILLGEELQAREKADSGKEYSLDDIQKRMKRRGIL